jgi:hypothetical protein
MVVAVVFAIYVLIDLILLLSAKVVDERVKPMVHALRINRHWKRMRHKENAIEGMCQLEESTMLRTKINGKGQVTIAAELRERFGNQEGHSH